MHNDVTLNYLSTDDGEKIAYKMSQGGEGYAGPTLIWCGGLKSDMEGGKNSETARSRAGPLMLCA